MNEWMNEWMDTEEGEPEILKLQQIKHTKPKKTAFARASFLAKLNTCSIRLAYLKKQKI